MSKERKFRTFKVELDGKETEFKVYEPTREDHKESNKVRNEAFNDAISSNAPLRAQLHLQMEKQGIWTEDHQRKMDELGQKLEDGDRKLAEGGENFLLDDARKLALDMVQWRAQRRNLLADLSRLDNNTAEGQADNAAFNYLISACLVYNKEDKEVKYFDNLEDYLNHSGDVIGLRAANELASLMYNVGSDTEKRLPENKFLLDFDFVNEDLQLINEDGHLIDADGRLINENGNYVDKDGNFVDRDGNPVTEDGEFKVEFKGFVKDGKIVMGKSRSKADEEIEPESQNMKGEESNV